MAIQESITVSLAEVEVNDDYRVELKQKQKLMDYSPEQAIALAGELVTAAEEAIAAMDDHQAEVLARMTAAQPRTVTGEAVL